MPDFRFIDKSRLSPPKAVRYIGDQPFKETMQCGVRVIFTPSDDPLEHLVAFVDRNDVYNNLLALDEIYEAAHDVDEAVRVRDLYKAIESNKEAFADLLAPVLQDLGFQRVKLAPAKKARAKK